MIQELKIKNFKSFKEEVTLSFEASKDTTFEDYQVVEVAPGVRLLRFAMVYGANASGKSNLLEAFEALHDFITNDPKNDEKLTGTIPFKLDTETPSMPTEFLLKFYVDKTKYSYELKLTQKLVLFEKLSYYRTSQPIMLFERTFKDGQSVITFNPTAIKISAAAKEQLSLKCLPNMSFLSAKSKVNLAIEKIDIAKDWLKNNILPMVSPKSDMFNYAISEMFSNDDLKKYLMDFVHKADFNITDARSDQVTRSIPKPIVNMLLAAEDMPDELREKLKTEPSIPSIQLEFQHTVRNKRGIENYFMSTDSQSEGTRRAFGIEAAIYEALKDQSFLPIDEIESSLHPEIVEFVLQRFLGTKGRSQLLITTHYDPLLNTVGDDLIRKDSVWFTEKKESGATDLYSLIEYRGINRIASLQKAYRNGVFGALPIIKE